MRPDPAAFNPDGTDATSGTVVVSPTADGDSQVEDGSSRGLGAIARVFSRSAVNLSVGGGGGAAAKSAEPPRVPSSGYNSDDEEEEDKEEDVRPRAGTGSSIHRRRRPAPLLFPRSKSDHGDDERSKSPSIMSGWRTKKSSMSKQHRQQNRTEQPIEVTGGSVAQDAHMTTAMAASLRGGSGSDGRQPDVVASLPSSLPKMLRHDVDVDSDDESDRGDERTRQSHKSSTGKNHALCKDERTQQSPKTSPGRNHTLFDFSWGRWTCVNERIRRQRACLGFM